MPKLQRPLLVALVVLATLLHSGAGASARFVADTTFPPGSLIALQDSPHRWIVHDDASLSWVGDTRALAQLADQGYDLSSPIGVTLDTLKTQQIGDPILSTGMLREGSSLYLVKWEEADSAPRLLRIGCLPAFALFGITPQSSSNLAMDSSQWEASYGFQVSELQRGDLESIDPSVAACATATPTRTPTAVPPPRARILLSQADLASLASTLQLFGLSPDQINVTRTTSLVSNPRSAVLAAPLATAPAQTLANLSTATVPLGVLKISRDAGISSGILSSGVYLVVVRNGQVSFVDSSGTETVSARPLDARRLARTLPAPQTILTVQDVCFGWGQTQVCTEPSPLAALTETERRDLQTKMSAALGSLSLNPADINVSATVSEAEGSDAVAQQQANVIVAPANALTKFLQGVPPNGTLVAVLFVDKLAVAIPNHPTIPPGAYAVHIMQAGGRADLIPGSPIGALPETTDLMVASRESRAQPAALNVPVKALQVRAAPPAGQQEPALAIIANWCVGGGGNSDLCFLGEPDR